MFRINNKKMPIGIRMALNRQKIGMIILVGFLVAALAFLFSVAGKKSFRANTDLLAIQKNEEAKDFYTLFKSTEFLGNVMSEAVYSELFIDELIATGKVSQQFLPTNKKERLEEWRKLVAVIPNPQNGIIKVKVFSDSQKEVVALSEGIIQVISAKNDLFLGEANLEMKVLSGPIYEKNPSIAEVIMAIIGGFLVGIFVSGIWTYYFSSGMASGNVAYGKDEEEYLESLRNLDK